MSSPRPFLPVLFLLSIPAFLVSIVVSCASDPHPLREHGAQSLATSRRSREDQERFEASRRRSAPSVRERFEQSLRQPRAQPEPPEALPAREETPLRESPAPAPEVARRAVVPYEPPQSTVASAAPSRTKASPELQAYIDRLNKTRTASDAFWELCAVPEHLIAEMVELVESEEPTKLETVAILVVDPNYVRHGKRFLASEIPGMGALERFDSEGLVDWRAYTKKSYNTARNGWGYRVVLDKFGGFTLGIAMRAALLNRFMRAVRQNDLRELRQPQGIDHRRHLRNWWRHYHTLMRDHLDLSEEPGASARGTG